MLRSLGIGVRVTWDNLPGKPAIFPPSAHTHAWVDITGKPNVYPPAAHTHLWADITDKPSTFPPAVHTHAWAEITAKPATYPPSAHTHLWADITDRPTIPAATPLSDAAPAALAKTAAAGTSTSAARGDHVHPLPAGRLELVGTYTQSETMLVSLNVGVARRSATLAGVLATDKLLAILSGAPTAGCELLNVYATAANTISIGLYMPALGVGATYSVPITVYRIT